jgi:hypothetical protein
MDATLLTYLRFAAYVVIAGILIIYAIIDRRERVLHLALSLYFVSRILVTSAQTFHATGLALALADYVTTPLLALLVFLYTRHLLLQSHWNAHNRRRA